MDDQSVGGVGGVNTLLEIELVKLVELDERVFAAIPDLGEGVGAGV